MLPAANPYDFTHPVRDPSHLVGRQGEIRRLRTYLDLACASPPHLTNLVILGPRGIGKTSLLNAAHHMASDRGFAVVKMSLDDRMVASDLRFFAEIFSGFGTAPPDLESNHAVVQALRGVLDGLRAAGRPGAVLLVDECDLLAANKTLLQKIRNYFTEVEGFLLMLAGTPDQFPAVTETFGPFTRFFESVVLRGFPALEDAWACMAEPLGPSAAEALDRESVENVHLLTNGMPYEVKLLAHYMHDACSARGERTLKLSTGVLDRARQRLEAFRSRPFSLRTPLVGLSREELEFCRLLLELPAAYPSLLRVVFLLGALVGGDAPAFDARRTAFERSRRSLAQRGLADPSIPDFIFPTEAFARVYLGHAVREHGLPLADRADPLLNLLRHLAEGLLTGRERARIFLAYREPDGRTACAVEASRAEAGGQPSITVAEGSGPAGGTWSLRLPGVPGHVVVGTDPSADDGWLRRTAERLERAGVSMAPSQ